MRARQVGSPFGGRPAGRAATVASALTAAALIVVALVFLVWPLEKKERPAGGGGPDAKAGAPAGATAGQEIADAGKAAPETGKDRADDSPPAGGKDAAAAPGEAGPKGSLSGFVRVADTDRPAPGVVVVVRPEMPGGGGGGDLQKTFQPPKIEDGDRSATAGDDGRYRVEGLGAGEYRAFALRGETRFVSIPPARGKTFAVGADLDPQTLDIEVAPGGTIHGKVLDGDDAPIAGARIDTLPRDFLSAAFDPDSDFQGQAGTTSKEDGSYRIAGLSLDRSYLVMAEKEGRRSAFEEIAISEEETDIEADLVILPGGAVSGRVVTADGQPAPDAEVRLVTAAEGIFNTVSNRECRSDPAGGFRFEKVPAGEYIVAAGAGGTGGAGGPSQAGITCDGRKEVANLLLTITAPSPDGTVVKGRVTDDTGGPVPGAQISFSGFVPGKGPLQANATATDDGSFTLGKIAKGVFTLKVDHEKYAPFLKTAISDISAPLDVVLHRVGTIRGSVVARADGAPIAGATVRAIPVTTGDTVSALMAGQVPGGPPTAKTGDDGSFAIEKVSPGAVRVRAEASRLAPGYSKEVSLEPGGDADEVVVILSSGATISGVVVGPDRRPVADATVRASEVSGTLMEDQLRRMMPTLLGGGRTPTATTDADGTFRLRHLPDGKFILAASHPDFAPSAELETAVETDGKAEGIALALRKPAALKVQVRNRDKPMSGLMVQVVGEGPMKMGTTDSDGKIGFDGLAPGEYLVQVLQLAQMMAGRTLGMKQVVAEIGEGATKELDIRFGVGATIRGKVIGKLPAPMAIVVIHRPDAPRPENLNPGDFKASIQATKYNVSMAMIEGDGTFAVPDVPDGEFVLQVPRMPQDYSKADKLTPEERKPLFEGPVKVRDGEGKEIQFPVIRLPGESGE